MPLSRSSLSCQVWKVRPPGRPDRARASSAGRRRCVFSTCARSLHALAQLDVVLRELRRDVDLRRARRRLRAAPCGTRPRSCRAASRRPRARARSCSGRALSLPREVVPHERVLVALVERDRAGGLAVDDQRRGARRLCIWREYSAYAVSALSAEDRRLRVAPLAEAAAVAVEEVDRRRGSAARTRWPASALISASIASEVVSIASDSPPDIVIDSFAPVKLPSLPCSAARRFRPRPRRPPASR